MSALRIGACIVAAIALAGAPRAEAQVATGGVWLGYGVHAVAPFVLVPLYPHYLAPDPLRFADDLPSCYRYGRCSLRDLERFRDRPHRLERLAPAPPALPPPPAAAASRAAVEPTPEANIRPEYRGASVPREEFSESGKPR